MSKKQNPEEKAVTDYYSSKKYHENLSKDFIIKKQQKDLIRLANEVLKLSKLNSDLHQRIAMISLTETKYLKALDDIRALQLENKNLDEKNYNELRKLKDNLEQVKNEKINEELKFNRNMTIYNQKMEIVHQVELENDVFRQELRELKKEKQEIIDDAHKKIESLEVENQIKYANFKKKMVNNLIEAKNNVSKLNLEYMDTNSKLVVLQNHQLLSEIEVQKDLIDQLENEIKQLKNKIFELEKDLDIHKKVELKLAYKLKSDKEEYNEKKNKTFYKKNDNNINSFNNTMTSFTERNNINNIPPLLPISKNNFQQIIIDKKTKTPLTYRSTTDKYRVNNDNYSSNENHFNVQSSTLENWRGAKLYKTIKEREEEISKLKSINENLTCKIAEYFGKYKGLFKFLEESLNSFFKESELFLTTKNVNIDIENIKKFNFENFSKEEKYGLLLLLMKYLLPLVSMNYSNNCCGITSGVNLNLNVLNRKEKSTDKYLKDPCLKKAFANKKIKNSLFLNKNSSGNSCAYGNSIPLLIKQDNTIDSRFKNDKFKSLID